MILPLICACGAASPPATTATTATPSEESEASSPEAIVISPLPGETGWTHDAARWGIAQRAVQDIANADVHEEFGLGLGISNHEALLICPEAAMVHRVEDTPSVEVTTSAVDDIAVMIEGMEFLDAEEPSTFLCHPEWPVCVQESHLYVFAGEHLASIDSELDFNVSSYEVDEREWILGEIERRTHIRRDACTNGYAALRNNS